jgi:putative ABC transport system ATP-binding protein
MSEVRERPAVDRGQAMQPLLEVDGVSKSYRRGSEEVHALRGVTFALSSSEVVALFGPSGSGKSTLLAILAGWEWPDEGAVTWCDGGPPPADRLWSDVAVLPQTLGLLEELSVRENVELPLRLRGARERHERVEGFLRYLGLDDLAERVPAEISIGEQQRTALARALVLAPRLFLADEPTGHQDEEWAKVVFKTMKLASRMGTTCFIATHNEEATKIADRVLTMRDGVLGSSETLGRP